MRIEMKIKVTNKGLYECSPITLQANGLDNEQINELLLGKTININKTLGENLIQNGLAVESEAPDGSGNLQP
jgi:hypothetical protein